MKKLLSVLLCLFIVASILTVSATAGAVSGKAVYDFNNLTGGSNGVLTEPDGTFATLSATAYQNDSTPYCDVFVDDKGNGDKALSMRQTKEANFGILFNTIPVQKDAVKVKCTVELENMYATRYIGFYDSWHSSMPWLGIITGAGGIYLCGRDLSGGYQASVGDVLDYEFILDLSTGNTFTTVKRNGNPWISLVQNYPFLQTKFSTSGFSNFAFYQLSYWGNGEPAVFNVDNVSIEGIGRFYDHVNPSYDFEDFEGTDDGMTAPAGFNRAYGTPKTSASEPYEGIFAVNTEKGTSVKFESNVERRGNTKDAPMISKAVDIKSTETGVIDVSVYRPDNAASLYINVGTYNMPLLQIVGGNGAVYMFDKYTGLSIGNNKWYDLKIRFNTSDLSAVIDMYCDGQRAGATDIKQTASSNSYNNVLGKDIRQIMIGMFLWDSINFNPGDVSSIIVDDIVIGKGEKVYSPSAEGYSEFDIAYSSPLDGICVPSGMDVIVAFNNKINQSTFNSSTVSVNGVPVSGIYFSGDYKVVLPGICPETDKLYKVEFTGVEDVNGNKLNDYITFTTQKKSFEMTNLSFVNSDETESLVFAVPGTVKAKFTAVANNGFAQDAFFGVAMYEADSTAKLVDCSIEKITISGSEKLYTKEFTIPDDGNEYVVKAFAWDSESLKPLKPAAELVCVSQLSQPVVIIKMDDLAATNIDSFEKWAEYAKTENVNLGFGLLCNSFDSERTNVSQTLINRLSALNSNSNVEIWLHGYDHAGGSGTASEFRESFWDQAETFDDCIRVGEYAGITFKSLNPGFNELNNDTYKLIDEAYSDITTVMMVQDEDPVANYDGEKNFNVIYNTNALELNAGKPGIDNLERVSELSDFINRFNELKENGHNYILLQGHPAQWNANSDARFKAIVNYLKSIGCVFAQPAQMSPFAQ